MTGTPTSPPLWAARLHRWAQIASEDLLGGPRPWRLSDVINLQKGASLPVLALLALLYGNQTPGAWLYVGLHGGYGLVWLLKEAAFPDARWRVRVTIPGGIMAFVGVLGWYWVIGWLLIRRPTPPAYPLPDPLWFALAVILCLTGTAIMVAADAQKHFLLRERPGLIRTGMFRRIRHPNYLGEMMIYGSFALLAHHWGAWLILGAIWLLIFLPNMAVKEARMARHPGWEVWRAETGWILPRLLPPRAQRETGTKSAAPTIDGRPRPD